MDDRRTLLWPAVATNPALYRAALHDGEGPRIPWHDDAGSPRSSQVFCISAFGALRDLAQRDRILEALVRRAFPTLAITLPRTWRIELELQRPELLGETGAGHATSLDALCSSPSLVIAVESKFLRDAGDGFGTCSQQRRGHCLGFFGPGSDAKTGTHAWCRLETWDGHRAPRLYWTLGRPYFQADVFRPQEPGERCPLGGPSYQLMRNFLLAATLAREEGKAELGVLALAPRARAALLRDQVERFRTEVLRPELRERVALATYEDLIELLEASGEPAAIELGRFLSARIALAEGKDG